MATLDKAVDISIDAVFRKLKVLNVPVKYDNRIGDKTLRRIGAEEAIGYAMVYKIQDENTLLLRDYLRSVR